MNFYNEIDPYAADWLKSLIQSQLIPPGFVDTRPIQDVPPKDLAPYVQCHFFAGLGGWPRALHLAGIPPDRPLWTGSCPCQSFSQAGASRGFADERHLWPFWFHLIEQSRPDLVFGEQVASKLALSWFALVYADLESAGYAVGSTDLCAASVGAPHIRQRLWFVADMQVERRDARRPSEAPRRQAIEPLGYRDDRGGMVNPESEQVGLPGRARQSRGAVGELAHPNGGHSGAEGLQRSGQHGLVAQDGGAGELGNTGGERLAFGSQPTDRRGIIWQQGAPASSTSYWSNCDWLPCTDGKARPVEPGTFPLAHGVPARVAKLRALGNAIVPQVAAAFIKAALTP